MTLPSGFSRRVFPAGKRIFSAGDTGHQMYFVERGRVRIWTESEDGRLILGHIGRGGVFGELAIIDQSPRMAHATAVEETVTLTIHEHAFRKRLSDQDPFLSAVFRVLARNIREMAVALERAHARHADVPAPRQVVDQPEDGKADTDDGPLRIDYE